MGFFDSMKGFLGGVGDLIGGVVASPVGQQFLGAGLNLGFEKLFGTQSRQAPSFNPGGSFAQFGGLQLPQFQFPQQQFPQQQFPQQQFPVQQPFRDPTGGALRFGPQANAPFGTVPQPQPQFGGGQMPAFVDARFQGGGVMPAAFDIPGFDLRSPIVAQGAGGNTCASMFRPNQLSITPNSLVMVPNPQTGAPVFFKHAGKPILFSGDLRAAKMVHKLARRARRASPRR